MANQKQIKSKTKANQKQNKQNKQNKQGRASTNRERTERNAVTIFTDRDRQGITLQKTNIVISNGLEFQPVNFLLIAG